MRKKPRYLSARQYNLLKIKKDELKLPDTFTVGVDYYGKKTIAEVDWSLFVFTYAEEMIKNIKNTDFESPLTIDPNVPDVFFVYQGKGLVLGDINESIAARCKPLYDYYLEITQKKVKKFKGFKGR